MGRNHRAYLRLGHAFVTLAAVARTSGGEYAIRAISSCAGAVSSGVSSRHPEPPCLFFANPSMPIPWLGAQLRGSQPHRHARVSHYPPAALARWPRTRRCPLPGLESSLHGDGGGEERMSAAEALEGAIRDLRASTVPEPEASAEVLLSAVMDASRSKIRLEGRSMAMTDEQAATYTRYVSERQKRMPVQYIIGEWEFYNLDRILVRPPTLIPRPETEELVDMIIKAHPQPPKTFLEVGPGSGVISLSLLKAWPQCRATAVDLCEHAVRLTRDNAQLHGMSDRISVVHSGIAEYTQSGAASPKSFDLIVSNPPYIPSEEMNDLEAEVIDHEDSIALDGGADGLDVVREIRKLVRGGGSVWMEVDRSHPERLATHPSPASGVSFGEWKRDLSGKPRFVKYDVAQ